MNYTTVERVDKLWAHIDGAYVPNTIRAYKADMGEFIRYCNENSVCALPAAPIDISKFLLGTMVQSIKSATIRRKIASISAVHRLSNFDDPTKHPEVKLCIRKINRKLGNRFDQAFPITRALLDQLLSVCGTDIRGLRDRALQLLAYDSMRRRAELVSLRIEDIQIGEQGRCSILLRKSKTDQVSSGHWIHLTEETTEAITSWLRSSAINDGYLLRGINACNNVGAELGAGQISRIFKSLAQKANFQSDVVKAISGHSMRVGAAQDLLLQGASLPQIMVKGGWVKTDTVMRYVDKVRPHRLSAVIF